MRILTLGILHNNESMYICMYVCILVCAYACLYESMHARTYVFNIQLLRSVGWSFCRRECSFSSMRVGCICTYVCTTKFDMFSILVLTENNNSAWGLRTHQACLSAFGKYRDRVGFRDLRKFHENFSF